MKTFTLVRQTIPARLQSIPQPPAILEVASHNWDDLLSRPAVAIVGSRKPSDYGRRVTEQLARELASLGLVIVSGLAFGIDSIAHRAALAAGGLTIAVLPAGLSQPYPFSHRRLAETIVEQGGALVSEYSNACVHPHRYQFVERNRLIAGLSRLVIVTDAAAGSGSRHTVDFARDQGRDVMAVPGNITASGSAGPNSHIREGAGVILSSQDVLDSLNLKRLELPPQTALGLEPAQQTVWDLLSQGQWASTELEARSGLDPSQFNQALTMLEVKGRISQQGPGLWQAVS